jgi:hypothetical protein
MGKHSDDRVIVSVQEPETDFLWPQGPTQTPIMTAWSNIRGVAPSAVLRCADGYQQGEHE